MKHRSFYIGLFRMIVVGLVLCPFVGAQPSIEEQHAESLQVFFDHLYLVVDEETYDAIKESDFIRDVFCMFTEDTVSSGGRTWAGAYLKGEEAYIEIFGPGGLKDAEKGTIGMGFSTSRTGDINIVFERYKRSFGEGLEIELTKIEFDTFKLPWFYVLESDSSEGNPISSWVMEYHPMHLQFMGVIPDTAGFISRASYMTSMNSMIARETGQTVMPVLFRSITGISLAISQSELTRLSSELAAISYTMDVDKDVTVFHGPAISITCRVNPDPRYRVQSLSFSLSKRPEKETVMHFGPASVLTISTNGAGHWTFNGEL